MQNRDKQSSDKSIALLFGSVTLLTFLVLATDPPLGFGLGHSVSQFIVFPFIVFLVGRVQLLGRAIPGRLLILAAVAVALSGFAGKYLYLLNGERALLVATFEGDGLESDSRVFREAIRGSLKPGTDGLIERYPKEVDSRAAAHEVLRAQPERLGVVWGDKHWIRIALRGEAPVPISELLGSGLSAVLPPLIWVRSVPDLGLSFSPSGATASFMAQLVQAFSALARAEESKRPSDLAAAIAEFLEAGRVNARWSGYGHRGYAWWMVGNLYVVSAINNPQESIAILRCAESAYRFALGFVAKNAHPELRAAILNNRVVAQSLRSALEGRGGRVSKKSLRYLKLAYKIRNEKNGYESELIAPYVARANMRMLKRDSLKDTNVQRVKSGTVKKSRKGKGERKMKKKASGLRPKQRKRQAQE